MGVMNASASAPHRRSDRTIRVNWVKGHGVTGVTGVKRAQIMEVVQHARSRAFRLHVEVDALPEPTVSNSDLTPLSMNFEDHPKRHL
jgi:hypothetical protein